MKKLLSVLAAVGLTATASSAVVACTTTIKGDKIKYDGENASFTRKISIKKGMVFTQDKDGYVWNNKDEDSEQPDADATSMSGYVAFAAKASDVTAKKMQSDDSLKDITLSISIATADMKTSDVTKVTDGKFKVSSDFKASATISVSMDEAKIDAGKKGDITVVEYKAKKDGDSSKISIKNKYDMKINRPAASDKDKYKKTYVINPNFYVD